MKQYPNTLAATKSPEITALIDSMSVVGNGFFFTQEMLDNNESELASLATAAAGNTEIQTRLDATTIKLNEEVAAKKVVDDALSTANTTIKTNEAKIVKLQKELADEKAKPATDFQNTNRDKDPLTSEKLPFHESDEDPSNQIADSLFGKPVTKKVQQPA